MTKWVTKGRRLTIKLISWLPESKATSNSVNYKRADSGSTLHRVECHCHRQRYTCEQVAGPSTKTWKRHWRTLVVEFGVSGSKITKNNVDFFRKVVAEFVIDVEDWLKLDMTESAQTPYSELKQIFHNSGSRWKKPVYLVPLLNTAMEIFGQ